MIQVFNTNRLTRQPFFQDLINFLFLRDDVTLRQIKAAFSDEPAIDRKLEQYINAGYIIRENRRYRLGFTLLDSVDNLTFEQEIFVDTKSPVYEKLKKCCFIRQMTNPANRVVIEEEVDIVRERLTLDSYFYKMRTQEALSAEQETLYAILGDVNPDYALKYMTTFLLKFTRKEKVLQRRSDIFVQALQILGFIEQVEEQTYRLTMNLDKTNLIFKSKTKDES